MQNPIMPMLSVFDLLQAIETSLFSIYPIVFVIQLTWIVSVMTSVVVSPYVFVVLGYVTLSCSFYATRTLLCALCYAALLISLFSLHNL